MLRPLDFMLLTVQCVLTTAALAWIKPLCTVMVAGGWSAVTPSRLGALTTAMAIYYIGMAAWLWVMARNPLSIVYPIGIALSLVFTTAVAIVFLGEALTVSKVGGLGLVLLGTLSIMRSKTDNPATIAQPL